MSETRDALVCNYVIKFQGTPEEVREYILENDPEFLDRLHDVLVGGEPLGRYVRIRDYLKKNNAA